MVKHFNDQISMLLSKVENHERQIKTKEKEMKVLNVAIIDQKNEIANLKILNASYQTELIKSQKLSDYYQEISERLEREAK